MKGWRLCRASNSSARICQGALTQQWSIKAFRASASWDAWRKQSFHSSCWISLQVCHSLTHCITVWHSGCTQTDSQNPLWPQSSEHLQRPDAPSHSMFTPLPSSKQTLYARTTKLKNSFYLSAVWLLNIQHSAPSSIHTKQKCSYWSQV